MSTSQQCHQRNFLVREAEQEVRRLARILARTESPSTTIKVKVQLAEAKRQLRKTQEWREEHVAECGVLV